MKPNASEPFPSDNSLPILHTVNPLVVKNIEKKPNPCSVGVPQSEVNMTSPIKPDVFNSNASLHNNKTLLSQIVKFDFSFKKKTNSKLVLSPEDVIKELCQKIHISFEDLDREELLSIFQIAKEKQNCFQNIFCNNIAQSAFILCQILRCKLHQEISLMKTLNLIWNNCFSKKNLEKILKIVDYKIILTQSLNSKKYSDLQIKTFKNLKVSFVNVSFYFYIL